MDLVKRIICLSALVLSAASAQSLSLTIGNSVASGNYTLKGSPFIFRINGCADLPKAQVAATAEGSVGGSRQSTPLRLYPAQPGVYGIYQQWGKDGKWVVSISASCGTETTGAIVPVNGVTFVRESIQMLPHAPSKGEIEAALAAAH